jgi:heme A synthase
MSYPGDRNLVIPRWLHIWAIVTACAALPLVLLGAEVTTRQVGMVDSQSVRTPWHLFTVSLEEHGLGYVIEHSHRFAGWLVGACAIVLAVGMLRLPRPRLRCAGVLALVMVSIQGVLGIVRVKFNALAGTNFAMVHGLFAQLAFATLVGVAVVTSRAWQQGLRTDPAGLRKLAWLLAGLVYVQILFGAVVRHLHDATAQRIHVVLAFLVFAVVLRTARTIKNAPTKDRALNRFATLLHVLIGVQILLGIESWIGRFGAGKPLELLPPSLGRDVVRSLHFLVGTLLFASSLALVLFAYRPALAVMSTAAPERLEGAA